MLFAAIALLGIIGWQKIPVELFPALAGDQLYISFFRPGSEPEVVEREILIPLEGRVSELPGMEESWGEVRGRPGLFVGDASLFPMASEVNPYVTIMALADRVAERIRQRSGELLG